MIRMNMGRDILCLFFYSVFTEGSFFSVLFFFSVLPTTGLPFWLG